MVEERDRALLRLIDELAPQGASTDSEIVARALYEIERSAGRPAFLSNVDGRWWGLRNQLEPLAKAGLIQVEIGIAEFGQTAATPGTVFITVTDQGRELLALS